jgi:hypothetical protein
LDGETPLTSEQARAFPKAPHSTVSVYIEGGNIGSLIVRLFYNRFP